MTAATICGRCRVELRNAAYELRAEGARISRCPRFPLTYSFCVATPGAILNARSGDVYGEVV